jgi:AraC family transcriptional regulator
LSVDQENVTETFNIHFGEYWADEILSALIKSSDKLLTESYFTAPFQRVEFYNKLYLRDQRFNTFVELLRNNAGDDLAEEENLCEILICLLKQDQQIKKLVHQIPSVKNSTRNEILRRLLITSDYIHSFYQKDINLDELASTCCLSKFHFLRLFKIAFQKTPHQFINELRVNKAKILLKNGHLEVSDIARSLGFINPSSFSRMFYQQTGAYPSQLRK